MYLSVCAHTCVYTCASMHIYVCVHLCVHDYVNSNLTYTFSKFINLQKSKQEQEILAFNLPDLGKWNDNRNVKTCAHKLLISIHSVRNSRGTLTVKCFFLNL